MDFMTEVTGDALEAMQDVWDERESFTRTELGGVPEWADYVGRDGRLWSDWEAHDEFEEELTSLYGMVTVCGFEYEAGAALRSLDPTAFRCGFLDWEGDCISSGAWRYVEGR